MDNLETTNQPRSSTEPKINEYEMESDIQNPSNSSMHAGADHSDQRIISTDQIELLPNRPNKSNSGLGKF
jgi:hypothetical protein